ncbi:DNA-binding GntR family transcriptional regulator [Agrobacterium larrymoorei]|uniref:DNA-binding GntR family transcriptional regulator n=1 Tax=Agrobacterium larrymoorei TaxID=160699 RepID=A0AAJ2EQ72_9HYPH|nr:GntR family transcriptional regulator [Agrobacterium larrymoorei]MDR6100751.1 DNA-binding GntR family transcriptional regulator [Agrobacterium larrymoorei]
MKSATTGIAPRLYRRACDLLAADIANGVIVQGTRLTETMVANRFGISRAPARQALAELERLHLVRKTESRGYDVVAKNRSVQHTGTTEENSLPPADTMRMQPRSSWELIYDNIEIEIVSRTSLAAWRINEAMLAKHYGVSRTVARDVVARLQQRGIVHKDESGRWYAPALTTKHIDELYELRWILEPIALEKAVPNLPDGLLISLRKNVADAIQSVDKIDGEMLDALEQQLHVELLGYCQNASLMQAISLPQALLVAHHFLYHWTMELFDTEPFLPEHLAIFDSLLAGDIEGAKSALVRHLQISRSRAMKRITAVAEVISPDELPYLEKMEGG